MKTSSDGLVTTTICCEVQTRDKSHALNILIL